MIRRIGTILALLLAGCAKLSHVPEGARPADFELVLFVSSPSDRNVQYVLESDRTLRVLIGRDVTGEMYPPATATLTVTQMNHLWTLVDPFLKNPPEPPIATDTPRVIVTLTANGVRHDWLTSPDAPGVTELVKQLTILRSGEATPQNE